MVYLEWTDALKLGHPTIDFQHQSLVARINDLEQVKSRENGGHILLEVVLDELVKYTQYHFATEEKLMAKMDYHESEDHVKQHESFVSKIAQFREDFHQKKRDISDDLFQFLTKWLQNHILITDKAMVSELLASHPDIDPYFQ